MFLPTSRKEDFKNMKKDNTEAAATTTKAKRQFTSRLSPKKGGEVEAKDLGIPVVAELEVRLPVGAAAGRSHCAEA